MNWLTSLQEAINYIEDNLLEKEMVNASRVAGEIFSSEHNFRKIFSIITGVTLGEYIRNRKLSLAGEEIITTDDSILNIALKYGYDTPESFTKAFIRFHGVTPSYARKSKTGLCTYTRVVLKIDAGGGTVLDYSIEKLDNIRIAGYQKEFMDSDVEGNNTRIPEFVQESLAKDLTGLCSIKANGPFEDSIIGYRCDINERMYYTLGVVTELIDIPKNYSVIEIPARTWLKFKCPTPTKDVMQLLWHRIYTEFMPFCTYNIEDNITLEVSYCMNGKDEKFLYMPLLQDNK